MATLTINFTEGSTPDGYIVKYRVKGSSGAYTTVSPNPTASPVVISGLLPSTEYEGTITSNCIGEFNTVTNFYSCTCPSGFTPSNDMLRCEKLEIVLPDITHNNYCVAKSQRKEYGNIGTRIYNIGFNNTSISTYTPPAGDVYATLTTNELWKEYLAGTNSGINGPVNKAGIWLDSDCDGVKNSITVSEKTTFSFTYTHPDATKTIYVGVAGDNQFILTVNGVVVASTTNPVSTANFTIWHLIPVTLLQGTNYFNVVGTGDGSPDDCVAMTIYNNTSSELLAASSLSSLNILFSSEQLIGKTTDIVTCASGYSLDTSDGRSVCKKITRSDCTGVNT